MSYPSRPKPVLGLIGAIGAGKSAAATVLAEKGGLVIDADKLGHEALDDTGVKASLAMRWGNGVLKPDGSVNRRALAGIVFASEAERKGLEAMVFPFIGKAVEKKIDGGMSDPAVRFVVLDAAVMVEAGWRHAADKLLFVDAPRDVRLTRVASRGWTDADLTAREAAQLPLEVKRTMADAVIVNDETLDDLATALDGTLAAWGIVTTTPKDVTCRTT